MLRCLLPAVAFVALSTSVAAQPTASAPFSFSKWIEGIIADPTAPHLTPQEAVEAAMTAASDDHDFEARNPLTKRAWCRDDLADAPAADAAACLQDLARLGAEGVDCVIGPGTNVVQMCHIGNAHVIGSSSGLDPQGTNCNNVARTGGLIFDSCWRADNTVKGSETAIGNPRMQINIAGQGP